MAVSSADIHHEYLSLALQEAKKREGFCAPDPAVGALLVRQGRILSCGYSQGPSLPPAEEMALKSLTVGEAEGATLYVTLEPCGHHSRWLTCTQLIIQHKIADVYFGYLNPNPAISGQGITALHQASIPCYFLESPKIALFYNRYTHWHQTGLPFITAKLTLSGDSKIASPKGVPAVMTGSQLSFFTHKQRLIHDGILTTVKTVLADNPNFNAHLPAPIQNANYNSCAVDIKMETHAKPVYIIDRLLQLPENAQVLHTASNVVVFHGPQACPSKRALLQNKNVRCVQLSSLQAKAPQEEGMGHIFNELGGWGVHSLWIETGAIFFKSLLESHLASQIFVYTTKKNLGPYAYGPAWTWDDLKQHYDFSLFARYGLDCIWHWQHTQTLRENLIRH